MRESIRTAASETAHGRMDVLEAIKPAKKDLRGMVVSPFLA
jgi:hypothetical protein